MNLEQWLNDVCYDDWGKYLWAKDETGGLQMVGEVRGWGAIQQLFDNEEDAKKFQDQVGKFIAEAINEKVQRDFRDKKL